MRHRFKLLTLLVALLLSAPAWAELKLPAIIGDGMVLQRGQPATIWGWADKGADVSVTLAGEKAAAKAGADGLWVATVAKAGKLKAGGPYELNITTSKGDKATLKDVLVGEVWVCSGQSNMEWSFNHGVDDGEKEAAEANYPNIRFFSIPHVTGGEPQKDVPAKWAACTPDTAKPFSAVGYFFGRKLHKELGVPIGLIGSNWGGTPSEAWTSRAALESEPSLKPLLERWDQQVSAYNPEAVKADYEKSLADWQKVADAAKAAGKPAPNKPVPQASPALSPHRPANLYNAMIAPIARYALRGAIWYQGESNVTRAHQYRTIFPRMILNWREQFHQPHMPFYFVQIAPYNYGKLDAGDACAELWEAQLLTLKNVPDTGMAVINDIGNIKNIHPTNKKEVGKRLAFWALAKTYGQTDLVFSGPIYKGMKVSGDSIVLSFDQPGSGLASRDGKPLTHFQVAGEDQKFHPAVAKIEGKTLVVRGAEVAKPVAVRFAWESIAEPNLMNKEGLPASPFRTDTWKGVTEGNN